jgi:uncharacterized membrane protein YedE/YeeE
MGIIKVSFIFIVKDIVGFLDGLESYLGGFSFGFGDLVGVICESGLSIITSQ